MGPYCKTPLTLKILFFGFFKHPKGPPNPIQFQTPGGGPSAVFGLPKNPNFCFNPPRDPFPFFSFFFFFKKSPPIVPRCITSQPPTPFEILIHFFLAFFDIRLPFTSTLCPFKPQKHVKTKPQKHLFRTPRGFEIPFFPGGGHLCCGLFFLWLLQFPGLASLFF